MNKATERQSLALQVLSYSAYGHSVGGVATSLGFNGDWRIGVLQAYGLGHGHRYYRPALMRFLSPDALSPFGKGGVNTYAYCQDDPVNRSDPTGGAGMFKPAPGRVRRVAVVGPLKASDQTVPPEFRNKPVPPEFRNKPVPPELRKGTGKYKQAKIGPRGTVDFSDFGPSEGVSAAPVSVRPVRTVAAFMSQGPAIDELGDYWQAHWHREHRPGTQPMSMDQMIPNHQRGHSNQIADIERRRAFLREQDTRLEIDVQVLASFGHW